MRLICDKIFRTLRTFTTVGAQQECTATIKPYNEIPTEGVSDNSSNLDELDDPCYLHEQCDRLHRRLGPIFRKHLGTQELVFIADTSLIHSVIRNEGLYPHHSVPPCWAYYNKVKNLGRGVFFQTGETWAKLRKPLADVLLKDQKSITRFAKDLIDVNNDMVQEWRERSDGEIILTDVKRELCRWSIEATGCMLFGTRMGCIKTKTAQSNYLKAEQLVDNITEMFAMTAKFQVMPVAQAHELNNELWRRFETSMTTMLQLSDEYAREFLNVAYQSESKATLVGDIMKLGALNEFELRQSVVDLIIASADTTSTSLQWMLYLLSKNRDVQENVSQESHLLLDNKSDFTDYRELVPFTFGFIKETLRLYPTAPFLARTLDHDITLSNYRVPAGTPIVFSLYTTSRLRDYFEDPLNFRPERWLRRKQRTVVNRRCNSSASLPFGIGRRMCLGKRLAELQMTLLIASLTSTFELCPTQEDVKIKLMMTLGPEKPIKITLRPRLN